MLSVDRIYKTFNRFNILNGISFSQQEGEILALMGKNGSGKTTLLRIIARIMKPDSGSILFQGNELLSNNSLFRKNLLYLGHEPGMYSYLSAKENLRFALSFRYKSQPIAKIISKYCDIILIGDSMANVLYGMKNTHKINLETMINHSKAVKAGAKNSLLVVDMPKNSYRNVKIAKKNAKIIIKQTKCDAVKIESNFKNEMKELGYLD